MQLLHCSLPEAPLESARHCEEPALFMNTSAAIEDSPLRRTELRVSGFMFRVVRKDAPKTRNLLLETRNVPHSHGTQFRDEPS